MPRKPKTKADVAKAEDAVETTPVQTTAATSPAKAETKKTTTNKTTAAKRTTRAKKEVKEEIYLQFAGGEYSLEAIKQSIKNAWMEETGKKESDIKDLQIYVKPEECAAYYVINGEVEEGGRKVSL